MQTVYIAQHYNRKRKPSRMGARLIGKNEYESTRKDQCKFVNIRNLRNVEFTA